MSTCASSMSCSGITSPTSIRSAMSNWPESSSSSCLSSNNRRGRRPSFALKSASCSGRPNNKWLLAITCTVVMAMAGFGQCHHLMHQHVHQQITNKQHMIAKRNVNQQQQQMAAALSSPSKTHPIGGGPSLRPLEACQELISAAIARNILTNNADEMAQLDDHIPTLLKDKIIKFINQQQHLENNTDTPTSGNDHHEQGQHGMLAVLKQCLAVMAATALDLPESNEHTPSTSSIEDMLAQLSTSNSRYLPSEKKSWLYVPSASGMAEVESPSAAEAYAKKLDFFWNDLEGIRFKKRAGKIVRINSKPGSAAAMQPSKSVSKRMILLLMNMSIAKPLLEKFQRQQLRQQQQQQRRISKSASPLAYDYLNEHLLKSSDQSNQYNELNNVDEGVTPLLMHAIALSDHGQVDDDDSTTTTINLSTSPVPLDSMESNLVETRQPELESPRSKKVIEKDESIISRSAPGDPWDKEGIRFKRSSNEELDGSTGTMFVGIGHPNRAAAHFISAFDIFGQEGIRFKKSPFDDEGIRYKKSPFDDEGIRYKKSPFDDEGIRYKKSPFDDEGIRYKKSPFDDEGIRY